MIQPRHSNKTAPEYWEQACQTISQKDATFATIIERSQNEVLGKNPDAFVTLLRAINGQQISVKASSAIWNRVSQAIVSVSPATVLNCSPAQLQALGLSRQKTMYFHNAAQCFAEHPELMDMHWSEYEKMAERLITIKGVGQWTIEMVGIFHLNHPDIFPVSDIGLRRAIKSSYDISFDGDEAFADRWKPYRTVATWYLWRTLYFLPVQY